MPVKISIKTVGILGFGAFGRLIARHLRAHFELVVSDPELTADARLPANVRAGGVPEVGRCDLVILATPIEELAAVIFELRPHLRPGSVVTDVVSVKVRPVKIMQEMLPPFVDIIGTHPLSALKVRETALPVGRFPFAPYGAVRHCALQRFYVGYWGLRSTSRPQRNTTKRLQSSKALPT